MKRIPLSLQTYQPPQAEVMDLVPSQIICGSNEDITPGGGDIDWAPAFDAAFDGLL